MHTCVMSRVRSPLLATQMASLFPTRINAFLKRPRLWRPSTFNKGENRPNISVTENALKRWHIAFKPGPSCRLPAKLCNLEEKLIGMMPRVTGFIMRRGREPARRQRLLPIRLAFEVDAMTRGAMLTINRLASRYLLGVRRIRGAPGRVGLGGLNHLSCILGQQTLNELMRSGSCPIAVPWAAAHHIPRSIHEKIRWRAANAEPCRQLPIRVQHLRKTQTVTGHIGFDFFRGLAQVHRQHHKALRLIL